MDDLPGSVSRGIHCAVEVLGDRGRVVVLTGAGISTPSGIPDFRSTKSGLWEKFNPFEVASLSAYRYHPEKFFNWIRPLAREMRQAQPNPAHYALARLERAGYIQTIITQNIDSLHQRAGSCNVLDVHGSLDTLTCGSCYHKYSSQEFMGPFVDEGTIPLCPECGFILKPDIVLFGEQLPSSTWLKAQEASKKCDLMIVIGSSLEVLPVAGLPMRAIESGAHLILINQMPTYIDVRADVVFAGDVIDVLPRIAKEVLGDGIDTHRPDELAGTLPATD